MPVPRLLQALLGHTFRQVGGGGCRPSGPWLKGACRLLPVLPWLDRNFLVLGTDHFRARDSWAAAQRLTGYLQTSLGVVT
jgi:hypothetical protein